MKIQQVPLEYVHQVWGRVETLLAPHMQHAQDDYTLEQIKVLVTNGEWKLIVATDEHGIHGVMTVHLFNRPNDRVAFITAVGGKGIINPETYSQLKALVASMGATYIEAAGRKSVVRLLASCGLQEKYTIVGAKL